MLGLMATFSGASAIDVYTAAIDPNPPATPVKERRKPLAAKEGSTFV
jgi:hypothetical protein